MLTGTDLRKARLYAGKTTKDMAQLAGVKTRKTYENWEKQISTPNVNQFLNMLIGCGLDPVKVVNMICDRDNVDAPIEPGLAQLSHSKQQRLQKWKKWRS